MIRFIATFIFTLFLLTHCVFGQEYYACNCLLPEKYAPVVSCISELAVKDEPSKDGKTIAKMRFGQERGIYLDNKQEVQEEGKKRTYAQIRTDEGEEGWVNINNIVLCGQGRVVNQEISGREIEGKGKDATVFYAGEPVIITETKEGLVLAYSKDRSKMAYVPAESLISGNDEIKTALLLQQAYSTTEPAARLQKISNLKQYTNNNLQMYGIIEQAYYLAAANAPTPTVATSTFDDARGIADASSPINKTKKKSVRGTETKSPTTAAREVSTIASPSVSIAQITEKKSATPTKPTTEKPLTTTNKSKEGKTAKKLPPPTEKKAETREMPTAIATETPMITVNPSMQRETYNLCTQYWKYSENLSLKEASGLSEGEWVCNHATLPMGAKVHVAIPDNGGFVVLKVVGKAAEAGTIEVPKTIATRIFGEQLPKQIQASFYTTK